MLHIWGPHFAPAHEDAGDLESGNFYKGYVMSKAPSIADVISGRFRGLRETIVTRDGPEAVV
jgi:hypothetical protein